MCLLSLRQLRWQRCQILLTCRYESFIDVNNHFDIFIQEVRDKIVFERARMFELLSQFDFLEPFTSESNFILCRCALTSLHRAKLTIIFCPRVKRMSAEYVKACLLERGVVIRHYSSPKEIADCIRISIGRPEDTDAVVSALASIKL